MSRGRIDVVSSIDSWKKRRRRKKNRDGVWRNVGVTKHMKTLRCVRERGEWRGEVTWMQG